MFIIYIRFFKATTPSQRFLTKYFKIRFKKKINFFKFFLKNKAGRIFNNNKISTLSKGSIIKRRVFGIFLKKLVRCIFLNLVIIPCKHKLIIVCKQASGVLFILPYINGTKIGQLSSISNLPIKFFGFYGVGNVSLLKFTEKFTICSNIFFKNTIKYATACGTYCQVLDKFLEYNLVHIFLPSKKTITLSG